MHACMYVCMYVCLCVYVCMHACMHVCMYVCRCIYLIFIYIYILWKYIEFLPDLRTMIKQSQVDHPHRSESNDHLAPGCFSVGGSCGTRFFRVVCPKENACLKKQPLFVIFSRNPHGIILSNVWFISWLKDSIWRIVSWISLGVKVWHKPGCRLLSSRSCDVSNLPDLSSWASHCDKMASLMIIWAMLQIIKWSLLLHYCKLCPFENIIIDGCNHASHFVIDKPRLSGTNLGLHSRTLGGSGASDWTGRWPWDTMGKNHAKTALNHGD